jgi:hypothetical protein
MIQQNTYVTASVQSQAAVTQFNNVQNNLQAVNNQLTALNTPPNGVNISNLLAVAAGLMALVSGGSAISSVLTRRQRPSGTIVREQLMSYGECLGEREFEENINRENIKRKKKNFVQKMLEKDAESLPDPLKTSQQCLEKENETFGNSGIDLSSGSCKVGKNKGHNRARKQYVDSATKQGVFLPSWIDLASKDNDRPRGGNRNWESLSEFAGEASSSLIGNITNPILAGTLATLTTLLGRFVKKRTEEEIAKKRDLAQKRQLEKEMKEARRELDQHGPRSEP